MNIVFLGSGPFAVPALDALCRWVSSSSDASLLGVVSRPDRPARRGRKLVPMPLRARALELGLETWAPESINAPDFVEHLRGLRVDLAIVADYGQILREAALDSARVGFFNLHGSVLPRHRGAAPVAHAILAGDRETGVTLFRIEKGLDSGPIVATSTTTIGADETAGELEERLAVLAGELLAFRLDRFAAGSFEEIPQDDSTATLAPKIAKEEGRVDWALSAAAIALRVRAFHPWPTAFSWLVRHDGESSERTAFLRVKIDDASASRRSVPPGSVLEVDGTGFSVACGTGSLKVLELRPEGKSAMQVGAYLNGRSLAVADRFVSEPLPTETRS